MTRQPKAMKVALFNGKRKFKPRFKFIILCKISIEVTDPHCTCELERSSGHLSSL
ncbi:hypothetical protein SESBI_02267 [Sesbania bispinosa]|nr:hypothetical protein SESBI_02267 [Sesbania bispinosa]